jgi:hypothetical protein
MEIDIKLVEGWYYLILGTFQNDTDIRFLWSQLIPDW